MDPFEGSLYAFLGKRDDRLKVLFGQRGGFVLYDKRLEKGHFRMPKVTAGKHIAVLCTLTACCIEAGISPVEYYIDVLHRIDVHPKSRIDELLPHNWKRLREECQPQQAQAA